jgi:hypothetical protein
VARIASAFVELRPESVGFRNEARREIAAALSAVKASVPLSAESRGLRQEVARAASAAAAGAGIDVKVKADSKGLRGEISRAAQAAAAGQNVSVGVKLDERKLKSLLASVAGGVTGAGGALGALTIPPAFLQGIAAATAGLVAMGGAAVAVLAPLSRLAGLVPALAVGGIAVAAGFGVVAGALSGVGDALKAYSAEQKEAATAAVSGGQSALAAARAQEAAADAVVDASERLEQAEENRRRSAERSAEAVADAQDAVTDAYDAQRESADRSSEAIAEADARLVRARQEVGEVAERSAEQVVEAGRRMETAQRSLSAAEADAADAVRDLADARREAAEELEDQILTVERGALSEERARLNVERARQRQREVAKDAKATALDRQDAALDVREAELSLREVIERRADDEAKLNDLRRKGVAGADGVVAAEERVADAQQAVVDAQREATESTRDLARAQRDQARDNAAASAAVIEAQRDVAKAHAAAAKEAVASQERVADAVENLARAQRDAQRSAEDSQKAVAAAARDLERAMRRAGDVAEEAGTSGAASVDKFALAMEGLSPAAQSFVRALLGVKETVKGLRDTAAEGLFPGFERGLIGVKPLLDSLHPSVALVARTIGNLTAEIGALLGSPQGLAGFAALGGSSAAILDRIGRAAIILIPPIGQLLVHAIPLATALADMAVNGAKVFAAFVDGRAKTGELAAMFGRTEETLRLIGSIAGNVGGALRGLFRAALPAGEEYLSMINRATSRLRDMIRSDTGQSGLRKFFDESKPLVLEITGLIGDLVRGLGGIGARLGPELVPVVRMIRADLVPALLSLIDSIDGDFLATLVSLAVSVARFAEAFFAPTETLKVMLGVIGELADAATFLLTELGPLSVVIANVASALTLVGTALAGAAIVRKLSEIIGMRRGIDGLSTSLGAGGLAGTVSKVVVNVGPWLLLKSVIDQIAPSVDKTAAAILRMPVSVDAFDKSVQKLSKPGFWDQVVLQAKKNLSPELFIGLFRPLDHESKKAAEAAKTNFSTVFTQIAKDSPQFAFDLIAAMRSAGRPTADFEAIIRSLGLGQQFMAAETEKATEKIKAQKDAARDARAAELDMLDAVDRYSKSLEENGTSHDENTAKGRLNIRARDDMLAAVERNIEALVRSSKENGVNAGEVDQLRGRLEELRAKYPELSAQIDQFANDFNTSIDKIKNKEVTLSLVTGEKYVQGDGGKNLAGVGGMEKGGPVTRKLPRRGPTDIIPAWLAPGEYVATAADVRAAGGPGAIANAIAGAAHQGAPGYAMGGYVDFTMLLPDIGPMMAAAQANIDRSASAAVQRAQAELDAQESERAASPGPGGGAVGGGSIGSGWEEITRYLDRVGQDYTVTSTVRPGAVTSSGNLSNHALGKAVDMVGDMSSIFDVLLDIGRSLSELFYDPKGRSIKNGELVDWTVGGHDDHVHAATFDRGGTLEPGWNRVRNATGRREPLAPVSPSGRVGTGAGGGTTVLEIPLILNGREIARATVDDIADELDRKRKKRS